MRPHTLQDLLAELAARGLSVALSVEGELALEGPAGKATPGLRSACRLLREALLAYLRGEEPAPDPALGPREWLWRTGHTYSDGPADPYLFGHAGRHAFGAWWWRRSGEAGWRPIEGRCEPGLRPPAPLPVPPPWVPPPHEAAAAAPAAPQPAPAPGDAAMPTLPRECPFDGCGRKISPELFACPAHWRGLTQPQKSEVWACYSAWQKGEITGGELRARQRAVLDEAQGKAPARPGG